MTSTESPEVAGEDEAALAPPPAEKGRSPFRDGLRRLLRNRVAVAGAILLSLVVLACTLGPELLKWRGIRIDQMEVQLHNRPPDAMHVFGTDALGRDYLLRVLMGGRFSLLVGLAGTFVVIVVGALFGAFAGYFGGWVDTAMMRFVDFLYAIPFFFLVILLMLLLPEEERKNPLALFGAIGLVQWLTMARIVRGQVLSLREREFVQAARVMGASGARIVFRHLLPNCLGPIVVVATLTVPSVILLESLLSFLGLGVDLSWGVLVSEGVQVVNPLQIDWWLLLFPSLFLAVTLLSLNFLGDGLRDALDPKARHA